MAVPSKVLHSTEFAVTKIDVPGATVHDFTLFGAKGAIVLFPRSMHAYFWPPEPNGFWLLGVSSTVVVHSSARSLLCAGVD